VPAVADPRAQRDLARLCGTFHNVAYYVPEMKAFKAAGIPRYWHAYMAYRSAPMGPVSAAVVAATFYNFAPSFVAAAIPSVWAAMTPGDALALRDACVDLALRRVLGEAPAGGEVAAAAARVRQAGDACDGSARPLYAAHAALPWPAPPHLQLYRACTLWREHRGDSHNIALAAAGIDGIECHVLLAGKNERVKPATIEAIRGWSAADWRGATARLRARGLLDDTGGWTPAGHELRDAIEAHTDRLAAEPMARLGDDGAAALAAGLAPLVEQLITAGAVAARWP